MTHDVIVLGAGVAGSVAARRLACTGVSVALVGGESRPGIEGLSERSVRLLAEEGVGVDVAPALRGGRWGVRCIEGREWLIERTVLASMLRRGAGAAGVALHEEWARDRRRRDGQWRVLLNSGKILTAPWLIDARGRRGAALAGPTLLAVASMYYMPRASAAETRIEPFGSGWVWWARRGEKLFVQVTRRPRAAPLQDWLADAARELPTLATMLNRAKRCAPIAARPAHARLALKVRDDGLWRTGDAAFALDPLSGQGVYEALRSAQLIVTALGSVFKGGDLALAQRFVAERQQSGFERAVRLAANFYRENAALGDFWCDSAHRYEALLSPAPSVIDPHVAPRPVLLEGRIVLRDVLITPSHPRGVWPRRDVSPEALEQARGWPNQPAMSRDLAGTALHEESFSADS